MNSAPSLKYTGTVEITSAAAPPSTSHLCRSAHVNTGSYTPDQKAADGMLGFGANPASQEAGGHAAEPLGPKRNVRT